MRLVPTGPEPVLQAAPVLGHQLIQQKVGKYLRLRLNGVVALGAPVGITRDEYGTGTYLLKKQTTFLKCDLENDR